MFFKVKTSPRTAGTEPQMPQFHALRKEFPHHIPRYTYWQWKWAEDAWGMICRQGHLSPFSPAELPDLHREAAFWVMEALYFHYRVREPRLTWEEFLSLALRREDIKAGASYVVRTFPALSRPDLDILEQWTPGRRRSGIDYAAQKALFCDRTEALPLVIPTEVLEESAAAMASHLAVSLYVKKKTDNRRLAWSSFRAALEADPLSNEILAQRVRWAYSMNLWRLKMLWESSGVTIPPLRTNKAAG